MAESTLRADAQENHDRLLIIAARAFATDGPQASLKAMAKEAGVGIGTVYRRFPTREDLIEAVYRAETAKLCDSAGAVLGELGAVGGLRHWSNDFLAYMHIKQGMAEALPAILTAREGLRGESRQRIADAIEVFLTAGAAEGSLRANLSAADVSMALGGTTMITEYEGDPSLGRRLVDLLLEGLRAR
ncbi:TetR/AcrR family transcriptional regulator [Frondihabitans australicus]|uniref:TetR family transcriptional regulator n=1 Tax=Frondihabitans australicus TaxID=386892 RepID=A0A495IFT1_9MICO|nr:TetR/AcrR family transcriptional regulator [Frondihabitans australicus]RKR74794.1 TetR family transcriptional regulator [Frondihabitans australicus]